MILSGKEIEHHNIVTSTMLKKEVTYRSVLTVSKGCSRETSVAHIQAVAGTNAVECSSVYCLCRPYHGSMSVLQAQNMLVLKVLAHHFLFFCKVIQLAV
jgi:hypothetical protein